MAKTEDKGKTNTSDQSQLMGVKPFGWIGPDRTTEETKNVVSKLKKKKSGLLAEGSTSQSGEKANAGPVSSALSGFANGRK